MSELRKLRDSLQALYPRSLEIFNQNKSYSSGDTIRESKSHNLLRAHNYLWKAISAISRVIVEQEALSPAPQNSEQNERRKKSCEGYEWYEDKGSSVEYYKNQLAEDYLFECGIDGYLPPLSNKDKIAKSALAYHAALSASPDPEGSWEWVPNTCAVVPKEPTPHMADRGEIGMSHYWTTRTKVCACYDAMLAARPPVPKKGERV